jgi:hypothetical protein
LDDQVRANWEGSDGETGEPDDEEIGNEETDNEEIELLLLDGLWAWPLEWNLLHSLLHLGQGAILWLGSGCVKECENAWCRKGLASAYDGDLERIMEPRDEAFEDDRDSGCDDKEAIDDDI